MLETFIQLRKLLNYTSTLLEGFRSALVNSGCKDTRYTVENIQRQRNCFEFYLCRIYFERYRATEAEIFWKRL